MYYFSIICHCERHIYIVCTCYGLYNNLNPGQNPMKENVFICNKPHFKKWKTPWCYWPRDCRLVLRSPLIGCSLLLWYQTSDADAVSYTTCVSVQQEVEMQWWRVREWLMDVQRERGRSLHNDLMSVTHTHITTHVRVCVWLCQL